MILTVLVVPLLESEVKARAEAKIMKNHSVLKASLLGGVPGLGQLYNRQYGKAVLFGLGGLVGVAMTIGYNQSTNALRKEYDAGDINADFENITKSYEKDRKFNNIAFSITAAIVIGSILDAHLSARSVRKRNFQVVHITYRGPGLGIIYEF